MTWFLRFNDPTDYVSIPSAMVSGSLGSTAWYFEFRGVVRAFPSSGRQGILGAVGSSFANGFSISNLGQLQVMAAGNVILSTVADYFKLNELHTYRIRHLANGVTIFERNGVEVDSGYYIGTDTFASARALNRFGAESGSNMVAPLIDIEYIDVAGFTNAQQWNANLSNGAGTTFQTLTGLNQGSFLGTPVWFDYITPSVLKYHNGTAWVTKPLKYHNGTSWVTKPLKYHNGTAWR